MTTSYQAETGTAPSKATSSFSLVKVVAIVAAFVVVGLLGASMFITPADVDPNAIQVVDNVSADHKHSSHAHAHAHPHSHIHSHVNGGDVKEVQMAVGDKLKSVPHTIFSSKRNVAIFAVVIGLVLLLIAGCITAAVLLSMPTPAIPEPQPQPIEEPVVEDQSPQAVAERKLADVKAYLADKGLLFAASAGLTVLVVTLVVFFTVPGCLCSQRTAPFTLDYVKNFPKNSPIITALGVISICAVAAIAITIFQNQEFASYYGQFVCYLVAATFMTVSAAVGGPLFLSVVLGVSCGLCVLFLLFAGIRRCIYTGSTRTDVVDHIASLLGYNTTRNPTISRLAVILLPSISLISIVAALAFGQIDPIFYSISVVPVLCLVILIVTPIVLKKRAAAANAAAVVVVSGL